MSVADLIQAPPAEKNGSTSTAYRADFRAWAFEQADALRRRDFTRVDIENVVEELESLGRQEARQLYKRYLVLTAHLLKWRHQPQRRGNSWAGTIGEQRTRVAKLLRESPSLKSVDSMEFMDAYKAGRSRAAKETRLPENEFPTEPPFTLEQARDPDFWPEAAER